MAISSFDRIRYRHYDASVFLYAFDVLELNGDDLRRVLEGIVSKRKGSQYRSGRTADWLKARTRRRRQ